MHPRLLLFWACFCPLIVVAQAQEYGRDSHHHPHDTTHVVAQILRGGEWEGKLRTFGMATTNTGDLPDYHAWAIGGGIRYRTPLLLNHLRFELGGMFIYNLSRRTFKNGVAVIFQ